MEDQAIDVEETGEDAPKGHVFREVLGVRLLVKTPTVHQMVAYERVRAVLYARHMKIRANESDPMAQYQQLLPIVLELDSKALAFAESMLPDEQQRQVVDEWLITDQITPSDLVAHLLGRAAEPDDDADPAPVKPKPAPKGARPTKPARKTANAQRIRR